MKRRDYIECLRYDAEHKFKKYRKKLRKVLEKEEIEEIGGKLTAEEIKHIFGETVLWKKPTLQRELKSKYILVCESCGRYSRMRWYFEDLPDLNDLWKRLSKGKRTYSPKIELLECISKGHKVGFKPFEELERIKCLRWEIKHIKETKEQDAIMNKIFG